MESRAFKPDEEFLYRSESGLFSLAYTAAQLRLAWTRGRVTGNLRVTTDGVRWEPLHSIAAAVPESAYCAAQFRYVRGRAKIFMRAKNS